MTIIYTGAQRHCVTEDYDTALGIYLEAERQSEPIFHLTSKSSGYPVSLTTRAVTAICA